MFMDAWFRKEEPALDESTTSRYQVPLVSVLGGFGISGDTDAVPGSPSDISKGALTE